MWYILWLECPSVFVLFSLVLNREKEGSPVKWILLVRYHCYLICILFSTIHLSTYSGFKTYGIRNETMYCQLLGLINGLESNSTTWLIYCISYFVIMCFYGWMPFYAATIICLTLFLSLQFCRKTCPQSI
jgi:hypothetical protein